jgi:hypothetical protein
MRTSHVRTYWPMRFLRVLTNFRVTELRLDDMKRSTPERRIAGLMNLAESGKGEQHTTSSQCYGIIGISSMLTNNHEAR